MQNNCIYIKKQLHGLIRYSLDYTYIPNTGIHVHEQKYIGWTQLISIYKRKNYVTFLYASFLLFKAQFTCRTYLSVVIRSIMSILSTRWHCESIYGRLTWFRWCTETKENKKWKIILRSVVGYKYMHKYWFSGKYCEYKAIIGLTWASYKSVVTIYITQVFFHFFSLQ